MPMITSGVVGRPQRVVGQMGAGWMLVWPTHDRRTKWLVAVTAAALVAALSPIRPGVIWRPSLAASDRHVSTPGSAPGVVDPAVKDATGRVPVVVMAGGDVDRAAQAVRDAGGTVGRALPLIDGFGATVTAEQAARAA